MNAHTIDTKPFARFEWVLALRYLRSRRREGFISVIAGFSFLGIVGVATLIIVMAVMNGFQGAVQQDPRAGRPRAGLQDRRRLRRL
jgi:lipoprotein-releasing system permease protein